MKKISLIFLCALIGFAPVAHAQRSEETDPGFVIMDVLIYRPLGLAATVVGTGLFIAMSPLTALAAIPRPHDSFEKVGRILVITPATDTFVRPLGNQVFMVHSPDYLRRWLRPVTPSRKLNPAAPAAPGVQKPIQPSPGGRVTP